MREKNLSFFLYKCYYNIEAGDKMKKIISFITIIFSAFILSCCNNINIKNTNTSEPGNVIPEGTSITNTTQTNDQEPSANQKPEIDYSNAIFASPNGSGIGSKEDPTSLLDGISRLSINKNILYLYGGTYNLTEAIILRKAGDKDTMLKIESFKDEKVTLDFGKDYRKEQIVDGNYNNELYKGIVIKAPYYHIKGLKITNCGSHGMQIRGNYNIIEDCIFAYNGNTGLNISSGDKVSVSDRYHDNLVLNCTSYGNYDWNRSTDQGEDSDGFSCNLTSGINNVFDGCMSYFNSDDGWDLFTKQKTGKIGSVTIKNCVAFNNGYGINGEDLKNGNGFKLGGRAIEVDHYVYNSIAFNNKANGFDDNSNPGTITLKNCTAYNNGLRNYAMGRFLDDINTYKSTWYEDGVLVGPIENVPQSHNIFEDCISYIAPNTDTFSGIATNSFFYNKDDKYYGIKVESSCNSKRQPGPTYNIFNPFESLDIDISNLDDIHYKYRNEDKTINLKSFLKVKDGYGFGALLHS